ncbi:hypothetical protein [Candidatus Soleaferrea massiliensis]|uniref:hypothetical protein n=1 Tax=Candidatus Soleaferrea massiliensis TaxID=1470354 RepID=UPI00058D4A92|nr:hypothetical protein [Candidatus Soleaferrea massiliensis]
MKKEWKKQEGLTLASLLLCVPLTLSGCSNSVAGNSENPDSSTVRQEESGLESMVLYSKEQNGDLNYLRKVEGDNAYDNKYDFEEHGDFWQYAVKITSTAELEAAMGEKWEKYDSYGDNFTKGQLDTARYDEAFFAEQSLLVLSIYSGMNPVHLETLEKKEYGDIVAKIYEEREDDVKADRIVLIFAEVEKGYFDEDTEVEVCIGTKSVREADNGIPYEEYFSDLLLNTSYIPEVEGLQYAEDEQSANILIDNYEDYQKALEAIKARSRQTKYPQKSKEFFEEKAVLLHFDRDYAVPEYKWHTVTNVNVQNGVLNLDIDLGYVHKGRDIGNSCYSIALELDQEDVKGVQSFQVDQREVNISDDTEREDYREATLSHEAEKENE